jgi:beta-phosphoglucomutase-like phosphatase (HAD superfamily)
MAEEVGFIWDIDGVVLDSPHEESWRLTLEREPWNTEGLSSDFYFTHVASRPRYEGAHNILELLGVYERLGAVSEKDQDELLERYASEKDALIKELIARGEFELFADAVTLLLKAHRAGIMQAAASASKNASTMLKNVARSRVLEEVGDDFGAMSEGDTLYSMFDFDACGVELGGKVEILEYAAQGLESLPEASIDRFFVFEDAASSVEAAKSLGYMAIGVWRIGDRETLERMGADLVTDDLASVELDGLLRLGD